MQLDAHRGRLRILYKRPYNRLRSASYELGRLTAIRAWDIGVAAAALALDNS